MVGQCLNSADSLSHGSAALHLGNDSALIEHTGLSLELRYEQCLGQLAEKLAACVTAALETGQTEPTYNPSPSQTAALQALVETISQAFDKVVVAIALPHTNQFGETNFTINHRVATPALQICGNGSQCLPSPLETALELGQTFAIKEICQLQTRKDVSAWQIANGEQLIGWLLVRWLSVNPTGQLMGSLPLQARQFSLQAPLVQRAIAQTVVAIKQICLTQAQHQRQLDLTAQNRELTQANQFKSEFLANTSHEIRTPLSSILGFTHLLREQGVDLKNLRHHEYLNIILTSGQHLLALINDILDLSKIEANQLDLTQEVIEVQPVCQIVLALVKEKAHAKGLNLQLDVAPSAQRLVADPLRLKQMLFNLLANSIKFTQRGTVGLQVTATETAVYFTVWDTGIGISPEKQGLLFRPYAQIRNEVVGDSEGTGLGLALTQKLAELHGGKVKLVSEVNQGSRFTICLPKLPAIAEPASQLISDLPLAKPPQCSDLEQAVTRQLIAKVVAPDNSDVALKVAKPAPFTSARVLQNRYPLPLANGIVADNTILVVEDHPLNARLVKTYLKKLGYQVTLAQDGTEMWQVLERSHPALILMDVCLPEVDGLTLIQQLRADYRYQAIPVIVQTAMAMTGDREACLASGANAYISKPIDLEALARVVAEYITQSGQ